jgi:hypothetical protein
MKSLLHRTAALSIGLIVTLSAAASAAPAARSPYYGRWTVDEEKPVYTAKGKLYKTIDIAVCGRDFCGVSVGDDGKCGPTLFRFLASHADGETTLHGKGKWGTGRLNVQIDTYEGGDEPVKRYINLYLGEGHDFGERSDNMPKFHAEYRRLGEARCKVG